MDADGVVRAQRQAIGTTDVELQVAIARQVKRLQEQLRRRSEELAARQKALGDQGKVRETEIAALEKRRGELEAERQQAEEELAAVKAQFESRSHFFAIAAQLMRQILVDHARRRGAAKRGANAFKVTLSDLANKPGGDIDVLCDTPSPGVPLSVSVSASFTDPGVPDTFTCTVKWGDTSSSGGTVNLRLTFKYDASLRGVAKANEPVFRGKHKITLCRVHGLTALNTSCVLSQRARNERV